MAFKKNKITRRTTLLALVLLAIGLACTCNGFSLVATPTGLPYLPSTPVPTPVKSPMQVNPPTQVQPPTQELPTSPAPNILNPTAPWMIIGSTDGLSAANPDGSGLIQLVGGNRWLSDFSKAIQPKGNLVVVLTSGADPYHQLALNLLSLPEGNLQKITDLTNSQTEPAADAAPGTPSMEAMRAISEQASYSWSPDGKKLAFIGAMDGPSADVYIYDLSSESITRVSTDPDQDFGPSWSPDGKALLFFSADGFGTGAGMSMKGAWLANGDGSNVEMLYKPTSSGEELIGWRDDQTAILESWSPAYGPSQLRLFNIITKDTSPLHDGPVSAASADGGNLFPATDPGAVLFGMETGLYFLPSTETQAIQLSGNQVDTVRWIQDSSMFEVKFLDGSLATYQSDGSHREDAPTELSSAGYGAIDVAMYGAIWAWTESDGETPGAWISGPGLEIPKIFNEPAVAPLWDPHNNLIFSSGNSLFRVTFDSYYTDTGVVATLSGEVMYASWVGSQGFDIYGP